MTPIAKPFIGKYRAVVTDNADPSRLGRLRVRVADAAGDLEIGWAMPCIATIDCLPLPAVGAGVWIEFERGDPNHPIWCGFWWESPDDVPPAVAVPRPRRHR